MSPTEGDLQVITRFQTFLGGKLSSLILAALLFALCCPDLTGQSIDPEEGPAVERPDEAGIEVVLRRCLECHDASAAEGGLDLTTRSAALRGGDSGEALDVDAPLESLLWSRVEADEMPPEEPLSQQDKQALRQWLRAGAAWPAAPLDRFARSTTRRAGRDWWSWQQLRPVEVPDDPADTWSRNEVDRFIWQGLREKGLEPAVRAEPRTLVRRLYFDLVGLPAPLSVVEAFAREPSESAWEKLVDELLASPQYGEHWASHWLDIARFGESHGFEYNQPRMEAWRYRDWVISAINQDLPYDEFVRRQIAGDVIAGDTLAGLAPLGFLVGGPHNSVLGASETMRQTARQEGLEEMAGTLGQAFLGLTVNCARCHDHKFDPITAEEYYRFISALAGVQHSTRTAAGELPVELRAEQEARAQTLQLQLSRSYAERGSLGSSSANRMRIRIPRVANQSGQLYRLELSISPTVWAEGSQATQAADRLLVSLRDEGDREAGRRAFSSGSWQESGERQKFRTVSLEFAGNGSEFRELALEPEQFTGRFAAAVDWVSVSREGGNEVWRDEFAFVPESATRGFQSGTKLGLFCRAVLAGWSVEGLNSAHVVEFQPGQFAVQIFSGYPDSESSPETAEEKAWATELNEIQNSLRGPELFTAGSVQPGPMRIMHRGDVRQAGREVEPGGLRLIAGLNEDWQLDSRASDPERRARLAEWITAGGNGLFHRVVVNRIWHHHFGCGLLEKTSDFGFNGGQPSHPDLLEWLAVWFRDHGYSLKALHRLIVLSQTWRQSSRSSDYPLADQALGIDRNNRLLWRQNPRRLTAEALRDGMLQLAGVLKLGAGGEGYQDFVIERIGDAHYYRHRGELEPDCWRRSIYRFRVRGDRSPLLESFDCPDPSATAPSRNITTTPTQALALWNNELVLEMSVRLAERVRAEAASAEPEIWIESIWQRVLQREPTADEQAMASELVRQHGLETLARVLFNANEFLFVD